MRGENLKPVADFVVKEGESVPFVLRYAPSHLPDVELTDAQKALASTERFWREWVEKGQRIARWSDAVTRSLITLRALIYAPTGGIVAAPTTSLAKKLGGTRNWDYRFCWLRDATLALLALADVLKEAAALLREVAAREKTEEVDSVRLQPVFTALRLERAYRLVQGRRSTLDTDDDCPARETASPLHAC